jgi:hypothetical protein
VTEPAQRPPASLGEQFGRTRSSFSGLFRAHVDLFKAELGAIVGQIKTMAALGGIALALLLLVGNMLYIGGFLFLGEWLFGSIGWGLAHGVLFGIGLIVALLLALLGADVMTPLLSFIGAIVVMFAVGVLAATNVGYDLAAQVAGNLAQPFGSPGVVALIAGAILGAILFALLFARVGGRNGAVGGFVVGAVLGALIGWLIAGAPWTLPPALGFAITIGLIAWPILNFIFAWPGIDLEERFGGLYPRQSIEAVNETRSWLEEQWQTRQPKLGRK